MAIRFHSDDTMNKAWIICYIDVKQLDVIAHPCPYSNSGVVNIIESMGRMGKYMPH